VSAGTELDIFYRGQSPLLFDRQVCHGIAQ
jgi:hypothetical protein